jgi:hypothetical protein
VEVPGGVMVAVYVDVGALVGGGVGAPQDCRRKKQIKIAKTGLRIYILEKISPAYFTTI